MTTTQHCWNVMNWERQLKFVATRQTREGRENVSRVAPKVPMNAQIPTVEHPNNPPTRSNEGSISSYWSLSSNKHFRLQFINNNNNL